MKKIFAIAIALMMVMALSVSVFADVDVSGMDVAFEAADVTDQIATKTASELFGDKAADFIAAMNTEGAVLEVTITNEANDKGMMTNIFPTTSDWSNPAVLDSGYPTGGPHTYTIAAADILAKASGLEAFEDIRFQIGVYQEDDIKVALNSVKVYVPAGAATTAPADTTPADTTPADTTPADTTPADTAPADTTPAPSTGIALAVVPAIIALGAVAVSKKH